VVVAASIALVQILAARSGKPSFLALSIATIGAVAQTAVGATFSAIGGAAGAVADVPKYYSRSRDLETQNAALSAENARLREELSHVESDAAIARISGNVPDGIDANTIGYDPEAEARTITIDRGSLAGVTVDRPVINEDGVVGRVTEVGPIESKVLLIVDPASRVPAVVQRGRWWGIATGSITGLQLQYVSQDAPLKVGDLVVTGAGRTFAAGLPLGRISKIYHLDSALYQTATLEPAVSFGRLGKVLVVSR